MKDNMMIVVNYDGTAKNISKTELLRQWPELENFLLHCNMKSLTVEFDSQTKDYIKLEQVPGNIQTIIDRGNLELIDCQLAMIDGRIPTLDHVFKLIEEASAELNNMNELVDSIYEDPTTTEEKLIHLGNQQATQGQFLMDMKAVFVFLTRIQEGN